jgi:hypothetical protein
VVEFYYFLACLKGLAKIRPSRAGLEGAFVQQFQPDCADFRNDRDGLQTLEPLRDLLDACFFPHPAGVVEAPQVQGAGIRLISAHALLKLFTTSLRLPDANTGIS